MNWWNENWQEKTEVLSCVEPIPSAALSTTDFIRTTLALNLDLCYGKPTDNCHSYSMA
jgi:hypothetical protein